MSRIKCLANIFQGIVPQFIFYSLGGVLLIQWGLVGLYGLSHRNLNQNRAALFAATGGGFIHGLIFICLIKEHIVLLNDQAALRSRRNQVKSLVYIHSFMMACCCFRVSSLSQEQPRLKMGMLAEIFKCNLIVIMAISIFASCYLKDLSQDQGPELPC